MSWRKNTLKLFKEDEHQNSFFPQVAPVLTEEVLIWQTDMFHWIHFEAALLNGLNV